MIFTPIVKLIPYMTKYWRGKILVNLVNDSHFKFYLAKVWIWRRGDSLIYYCQKFGKHTFTNILLLQYFAMYGISVLYLKDCHVLSHHTYIKILFHQILFYRPHVALYSMGLSSHEHPTTQTWAPVHSNMSSQLISHKCLCHYWSGYLPVNEAERDPSGASILLPSIVQRFASQAWLQMIPCENYYVPGHLFSCRNGLFATVLEPKSCNMRLINNPKEHCMQ